MVVFNSVYCTSAVANLDFTNLDFTIIGRQLGMTVEVTGKNHEYTIIAVRILQPTPPRVPKSPPTVFHRSLSCHDLVRDYR
jgi:hypothetical protein